MGRKLIPALTFLFAFAAVSDTAAKGIPYGQFALHFATGLPQADFRQNVDNPGFGLSMQLEGGPRRAPWALGIAGGFIVYGTESRREPFSTTIPDVTVEVVTSNNLAFGDLFVRFAPRELSFRPYAILMLGFHYLFTRTEIRNASDPDEEIASSTNFSDFTWSYSAGAGFQYLLKETVKVDSTTGHKSKVRVFLDLQVRYQRGGMAEYLKKGSIRREGGKVTYDVSRSETDLLMVLLGVSVGF